MKKIIGAITVILLSVSFATGVFATPGSSDEIEIYQDVIASGKKGNTVHITGTIVTNNSNIQSLRVGIDASASVTTVTSSPDDDIFSNEMFEKTSTLLSTQNIANVKAGTKYGFTLSGKLRRDLPDGYYNVPIRIFKIEKNEDGTLIPEEQIDGEYHIQIYVSNEAKSSGSDKDTKEIKNVKFVLGEGQSTPAGTYPKVMDFSMNLANKGKMAAYDVTAKMELSSNSEEFPFEINEANYDRYFEYIGMNETAVLPYSFKIRSNAYTGFYPIKLKITYRESQGGEILEDEQLFYVKVNNKDPESEKSSFNANDRTKARIIVDGYHTEPADIYSGDKFTLFIDMKNASSNVDASNILFAFEPEKVSDSSVFSTESGSNSIVVNSLKAGESASIEMSFIAKAGIDQRSYAIKVKEQYDSPEFKNAEETVSIDIPVKQVSKFNLGTIEIMPESINVGDETNVMFPINNTGRVVLYNVMARFESDSIVENEAYVGNIKPGETGNVDVMLKGFAATTDDGKIRMIISYEDENGEVTETEKSITLWVSESFYEDDFMYEDMPIDIPEEKQPIYKSWIFWAAIAALIVGGVVAFRFIKKKKSKEESIDEIQ